MALKKPFVLNNTGINLPDAYHVVSRVETYKNNSEYLSNIIIVIYASKEARDSGKDFIIQRSVPTNNFIFQYNLSSNDNLLTQAYNYLKSTSEYQDSEDI